MKRVIVVAAMVAGFLGVPAVAQAGEPASIGVTGRTSWYPELMQTVSELARDYRMPIHNGCTGFDLCVTVKHYREKNGHAADAMIDGRRGEIRINDEYAEKNTAARRSILSHEFGHILGLPHNSTESGCSTSMLAGVAQCGSYVIGYSADEQRMIHERWG